MTTSAATPSPTALIATPSTPTQPAKSAGASKPAAAVKAKPVVKNKVASKAPIAAKVASPKTTKAATPVVAKSAKDAKIKKPKLVRDSFTIPKDEYLVIEALKQRAAALTQPVKKSELLRAGLKVLAGLSDGALRSALQAVPSIKTGRPKAETTAPAAVQKTSTKSPRK